MANCTGICDSAVATSDIEVPFMKVTDPPGVHAAAAPTGSTVIESGLAAAAVPVESPEKRRVAAPMTIPTRMPTSHLPRP
jgi:hypothetical protein